MPTPVELMDELVADALALRAVLAQEPAPPPPMLGGPSPAFQAFMLRYGGVGIDFDGAFGFQCMDLYRQYVKEVLGFPQSPPVVGAADVWDTFLVDFYHRIENTPPGVPDAGDIVVWGRTFGPFGHIAVALFGDTSKFYSFDQNMPLGSICHIQVHNYKSVLGWLKPKAQG